MDITARNGMITIMDWLVRFLIGTFTMLDRVAEFIVAILHGVVANLTSTPRAEAFGLTVVLVLVVLLWLRELFRIFGQVTSFTRPIRLRPSSGPVVIDSTANRLFSFLFTCILSVLLLSTLSFMIGYLWALIMG